MVNGTTRWLPVARYHESEQLLAYKALVAKPTSHPTLLAAVATAEGTAQSQTGQWSEGSGARQRTSTYRLVRDLPLALESPVRVTYVEVWEQTANGTLL